MDGSNRIPKYRNLFLSWIFLSVILWILGFVNVSHEQSHGGYSKILGMEPSFACLGVKNTNTTLLDALSHIQILKILLITVIMALVCLFLTALLRRLFSNLEKLSPKIWFRTHSWEIGFSILLLAYALAFIPLGLDASRDYTQLLTVSADQPYVTSILFYFLSGQFPDTIVYGATLPILLIVFFQPLFVLLGLLGFPLTFSRYICIFRFSQLAFTLFTFIFIYRIVKNLTGTRAYALGAGLIVMLMTAIFDWTLIIKPDTWMLGLTVVALYHFLEFSDRRKVKNLVWGAGMGGLAFSCKIWGFFLLIPMILISYENGSKKNFKQRTKTALQFLGIFLLTFGLFSPHYFFCWPATKRILSVANTLYNSADLLKALTGLFSQRLATLVSNKLGGPLIFAFFILTSLVSISSDLIASKKTKKLRLGPGSIISLYIYSFLAFYFVLYRDTFNVYSGERNVLCFVIPMVPVIVVGLSRFARNRNFVLRYAPAIAILSILAWQNLNHKIWAPPVRMMHTDLFKTWVKEFPRNDIPFIEGIFGVSPDGHVRILKSNLSKEDKDRYMALPILAESSEPIYFHIVGKYASRHSIRFEVRKWVARNVLKNSKILVEFYVDLGQFACYSPLNDLPEGTQIIQVSSTHMFVTSEDIVENNPDYIITSYQAVEDMIKTNFPKYTLIKELIEPGNKLAIFGKPPNL